MIDSFLFVFLLKELKIHERRFIKSYNNFKDISDCVLQKIDRKHENTDYRIFFTENHKVFILVYIL